MAWIPQTDRSHFVYGAGSWSKYYWDGDYNPGAKYVDRVGYDNCLANCTTLAYGRALENGYPAPVTSFRNANRWHLYANTAEGWSVLDYISGMLLYPGDIIEYSENTHYRNGSIVEDNHVGVVEEQATNPMQSSSWWTDRNLSLSLQQISDYFQSTERLQYRFYHYTTLGTENAQSSGGNPPRYVLRYTGSPVQPIPEVSALPAESYGEIDELATSADFRISVTVSNIPSAESVAGYLYCNGLIFTYESDWAYGSYTIDGTVYRYATKTVDLRYTREHNYAYSTVKYLTFEDTFSTGSVSLRAPIRITVAASKIDDTIIMLKAANKKKRIKHIIKI